MRVYYMSTYLYELYCAENCVQHYYQYDIQPV